MMKPLTQHWRQQHGLALSEALLAVAVTMLLVAHFLGAYAAQVRQNNAKGDVVWALSVAQAAAADVAQVRIPQSALAVGSGSSSALTVNGLQQASYLPAFFAPAPPSGYAAIGVRNEGPGLHPLIGILVVTGAVLPAAQADALQNIKSSNASASVVLIRAGQDSFTSQSGLEGSLTDYGLAAYADPPGTARLGVLTWTN